jgi:hypothetical protein
LSHRLGTTRRQRFNPVEAAAIQIVVDSVYPAVDYSSPSLAEVDVGLGNQSWLMALPDASAKGAPATDSVPH